LISTAAASGLESLIVDTRETAEAIFDHLRKHNIGRFEDVAERGSINLLFRSDEIEQSVRVGRGPDWREIAISTAAASGLESLIVDTRETAEAIFDHLRKHNIRRAGPVRSLRQDRCEARVISKCDSRGSRAGDPAL
jgi:chromosome segregation ATPase